MKISRGKILAIFGILTVTTQTVKLGFDFRKKALQVIAKGLPSLETYTKRLTKLSDWPGNH